MSRVQKVFQETVSIRDPIGACVDLDKYIRLELEKFRGKCHKGSFIIDILDIRRRSSCAIIKTNTLGHGAVDVEFVAAVAIVSKHDILVGARVAKKSPVFICTYEDVGEIPLKCVITFLGSDTVDSFTLGQTVPVRVFMAQHKPQQEQVSVVGTLLTCDQLTPAYHLRGSLDETARAPLAALALEIEEELSARASLDKDLLWMFEGLLLSYRAEAGGVPEEVPTGGTPWVGPAPIEEAGVSRHNAIEIARRVADGETVDVTGTWLRPLGYPRSSPLVAALAEGAAAPEGISATVDSLPVVAFVSFLKNIRDFLVAIRRLVETTTPESLKNNQSVWSVMKAAQRPRRA